MEYWASKADDDLFLFSAWYHSYKNRSNSTKPSTPTLQYSTTPWHTSTAKPNFSDLAQLPARRAYSPEGGPGFQCWNNPYSTLRNPGQNKLADHTARFNLPMSPTQIFSGQRSVVFRHGILQQPLIKHPPGLV
jgi:hypothetical protein